MSDQTVSQGYNGWTNYATWGVALVLSNDQGTYNASREMATQARADAPGSEQVKDDVWTLEQYARFTLADQLKDYTEELCGLENATLDRISPSMMAHQVIHAGLAEVDWNEIAENVLSELED